MDKEGMDKEGMDKEGMDKEAWKQPPRQDPDYLTDLTDCGWRGMEMCHGVGVSDGAGAGAGAVAGGSAAQCSAVQYVQRSAVAWYRAGLGLDWTGLGWAGQGNAEREAGKGGNGARWHRRRTQSTDKGGRPI